jgi:excisionase family DNA binding protein
MPPTEPAVLTVAEVAKLLRIGERQCREGIRLGHIQGCHKIGGQVRCSRVAIETWLNRPARKPSSGVDRMEMYR